MTRIEERVDLGKETSNNQGSKRTFFYIESKHIDKGALFFVNNTSSPPLHFKFCLFCVYIFVSTARCCPDSYVFTNVIWLKISSYFNCIFCGSIFVLPLNKLIFFLLFNFRRNMGLSPSIKSNHLIKKIKICYNWKRKWFHMTKKMIVFILLSVLCILQLTNLCIFLLHFQTCILSVGSYAYSSFADL